jgi:Outer membrane lipoprotein carrier protein LolA-like
MPGKHPTTGSTSMMSGLNRSRVLGALLIAASFAGVTGEAPLATPGTILKALASAPTTQLSYQEQRTLPALKTPLVFKGTLAFEAPDTLIKTVTSPHRISYRLSPLEIRMTDLENGESQSLSPDSVPELHVIGQSIVALLRGDETALDRRWVLSAGGRSAHWTLNLAPNGDPSSPIRLLRLEGSESRIQMIHIEASDASISDLKVKAP